MGMMCETPKMADGFGCPEHYATHVGEIEDAGGGNMRIYRCILRGGLLIPVYSLITPVEYLIADAPKARAIAIQLYAQKVGMKLPYH